MEKTNFSAQDLAILNSKKALKMMLGSGDKFSPEKTLRSIKYENELERLQIRLIELQNWVIEQKKKEFVFYLKVAMPLEKEVRSDGSPIILILDFIKYMPSLSRAQLN